MLSLRARGEGVGVLKAFACSSPSVIQATEDQLELATHGWEELDQASLSLISAQTKVNVFYSCFECIYHVAKVYGNSSVITFISRMYIKL